eukprot:5018478-Pyramimonas_sp.AAC.1
MSKSYILVLQTSFPPPPLQRRYAHINSEVQAGVFNTAGSSHHGSAVMPPAAQSSHRHSYPQHVELTHDHRWTSHAPRRVVLAPARLRLQVYIALAG